MHGEALHDYEVSLSEGSYTVVVGIMTDDPKQVILKFERGLRFEFVMYFTARRRLQAHGNIDTLNERQIFLI